MLRKTVSSYSTATPAAPVAADGEIQGSPTLAGTVDFYYKFKADFEAAEANLNTAKAALNSEALRVWWDNGNKANKVIFSGNEGKSVMVQLKDHYSAVPEDSLPAIEEAIGADKADALFEFKEVISVSLNAVPETYRSQFLDGVQALVRPHFCVVDKKGKLRGTFKDAADAQAFAGIIKGKVETPDLSGVDPDKTVPRTTTIVPVAGFHTIRHTVLTKEQNIALNRVVKVVAAVSEKKPSKKK